MFSNPDPEMVVVNKVEDFYDAMMATAVHHLETAFNGEAPEMMKTGALKKAQQKAEAAKAAAEAAFGVSKEILSGMQTRQAKSLIGHTNAVWQLCETELRNRRKAQQGQRRRPQGVRGKWSKR